VKKQYALLQVQVEDLTSTVSQLRDENMLLRAQASTGLGQVTDGSSVRHETFHMLEEARAQAHRWKTESEQKDLLIHKLVSTRPAGHLWQLCVPVSL
jgi:ribosomal protein L29